MPAFSLDYLHRVGTSVFTAAGATPAAADVVAGLVLGPDRRVRHLLVGGRPVVADSQLVGVDLRAAHRDLAQRASVLWD